MTLLVETPDTRVPERDYILGVVLGQFLGLRWRRRRIGGSEVRITLPDQPGEIRLPDVLLSTSEADWLAPESMPRQPLAVWNTRELGVKNLNVIEPTLPVIFGAGEARGTPEASCVELPVDIFGSAFFMLTRYEEIVRSDRDEHDRFPAWASLAYQEGFLERPIIDEYVEVLWGAMKSLWPQLERKQQHFAVQVSHDVDGASRYGFKAPLQLLRTMAGDMLKRRQILNPLLVPWIRLNIRRGLHPKDPHNAFDWIMDVSERNGLISAFYFICGRTDCKRDADYEADHPAIRALMRRIHERGHEIGLHPSYNTYKSPEKIASEARRLKGLCAEEGITQERWGGRMHFLRWEHPTTLYGWERADMTYDSTFTYADRPGFRCGTCIEYPAFDPVFRHPLDLRVRPLIAMDSSVMAARYMGLGPSERALEKFVQLKDACRKVNGAFRLLWHNTECGTRDKRELYQCILAS